MEPLKHFGISKDKYGKNMEGVCKSCGGGCASGCQYCSRCRSPGRRYDIEEEKERIKHGGIRRCALCGKHHTGRCAPGESTLDPNWSWT